MKKVNGVEWLRNEPLTWEEIADDFVCMLEFTTVNGHQIYMHRQFHEQYFKANIADRFGNTIYKIGNYIGLEAAARAFNKGSLTEETPVTPLIPVEEKDDA